MVRHWKDCKKRCGGRTLNRNGVCNVCKSIAKMRKDLGMK